MTTKKKKSLGGKVMTTMDVEPQWLEEVRGLGEGQTRTPSKAPAKTDKAETKDKDAKPSTEKAAAGSPPRTMKTMEVDPAWLEEIRNEIGASAAKAKRNVAPPPLPPAPHARPKRKAPPPIPREDSDDAPAKPAPRRSVRPPKR